MRKSEESHREAWSYSYFTKKSNILFFIGALSSSRNLVWMNLGGWKRYLKQLYRYYNVKATLFFQFLSKLKAHHQLAFKRSSGLLMQTNRSRQETRHSLIIFTLIYSTLLTNPCKFYRLKLNPKRLQETIKGCILFFNLRCLWAFEVMHIK